MNQTKNPHLSPDNTMSLAVTRALRKVEMEVAAARQEAMRTNSYEGLAVLLDHEDALRAARDELLALERERLREWRARRQMNRSGFSAF